MGEIAPEEQFLPLFTIFCYLMLDFYVKTRIRCSLRDKRLFEITEVEITRVDCITFHGVILQNFVYSQAPMLSIDKTIIIILCCGILFSLIEILFCIMQ